MTRQFITVDYEATLQQTVTLAECLPADHLARFIVGIIALLDLRAIYAGYAAVGGAYPLNNPGRYVASQDAPRGCCWARSVIRLAKLGNS